MKHISLLIALSLCICHGPLRAQIVGTNVFLQGRYVEIGMRLDGSFGATSSPSTYHAIACCSSVGAFTPGAALSAVYDPGHDGWAVGTPRAVGDFTLPGFPSEEWRLQVGAITYVSTSYTVPGTAITGYTNSGGSARAYWALTTPEGIAINTETRVDTNASWVRIKVKLRNTGSVSSPAIYFMRSCDPDNTSYMSGTPVTTNTIVYQSSASGTRAFVNASTTTPCITNIGLAANDSRARVVVMSGLVPSSAPSAYHSFAGGVALSAAGSSNVADNGIGIVFNLGTLAAGDSTSFSYAYVFNGVAGADSALMDSCTGTPVAGFVSANTSTACITTGVVLNVSGYSFASGLAMQWQASADSASWSNIPGATSLSYSFSGMTATTYYRCMVTCTLSGLQAATAGKKITYSSLCPCLHSAGTMTASLTSACSTASVTLHDTGYTASSGVALQWQSSADSSTWTDIGGATAVPYTFSGLGATTYYRLKATCIVTGLALYSNAKKVTFLSFCPCTGTPTAGTASASTGFCSSCSLTLTLSGASVNPDITYNWQKSVTGVSTWSDIVGATSTTYTSSPVNASYYRCKVRCSSSGATVFSNVVFVMVPYNIVEDSVQGPTDTSCSDQLFYVKVNNTPGISSSGSSPLTLKTYFGDGSTSVLPFLFPYLNVGHTYVYPGCYTVKQVVYYDTTPLDSITFTYNHAPCNIMRLKFFADLNHNCIKENFTEHFSGIPVLVRVDSSGVPIDTVSVTSGLYYRVFGPPGTVYSFQILPGNVYAVCPSSGIIYETVATTGSYNYPVRYFGLDCSSSEFDLTQYVVGAFSPVAFRIYIAVANLLCAPTDVDELFRFSPKYKYVPGSGAHGTTPNTNTPNSFYWHKTGVSGFALAYRFHPRAGVYSDPAVTLSIGDTVHTTYFVTPVTGDADTSNNYLERVDTIIAALDPNMIEVSPQGCFDNDTTLQYSIHFENTGNDTAYNVYVLDTISPNLDFRSMEILASTAEMDIYPYEEAGYKIVKFDFPNIKLLDSSWHGLNDGMFVYKIKTKAGLVTGESIFNRVGIYFDHNDVVMTNTVQNQKGCPVASVPVVKRGKGILLYPNPATDELTITTEQGAFTSFTITNTVGQQLLQQDVTGMQTKVSVKELPAGVYYVALRGEQRSEVRKFVKW